MPGKFSSNKFGDGDLLSPPSTNSSVNDEDISTYLNLYDSAQDESTYKQHSHGPRTSEQYAEALRITRAASSLKLNHPKHRKPTDIRRLPTLDTYEKSVEFHAQAPTRVLLRLERLMGTGKVNLTEPKYMKTLHHRLAQDEHEQWIRRSKLRMKAEDDRYRRLAVAGLVDPDTDKELGDLYFHPVFRVNRILDRLSKIDHDMCIAVQPTKRPIKPVEPFALYEETGLLFPFHPNHYATNLPSEEPSNSTIMTEYDFNPTIRFSETKKERHFHIPHFTMSGSITPISSSSSDSTKNSKLHPSGILAQRKSKNKSHGRRSTVKMSIHSQNSNNLSTELARMHSIFSQRTRFDVDDEAVDESNDEDDDTTTCTSNTTVTVTEEEAEEEMAKLEKAYKEIRDDTELNEIKKHYGIEVEEDLNSLWKRHRSPLLQMIDENNGVDELFNVSTKVIDTYKRKQLKTEDFCKKVQKNFFSKT